MPQARSSSSKRRSARSSAKSSAAQQRANADKVPAEAAITDVPSTVTTIGTGKNAKPFVQVNDLTKRSDSDIIVGHFATIVADHEFEYPDAEGEPSGRKIALIGQRVLLEGVVEVGDDGYPTVVRVRLGRPSNATIQVPYADLAPATA